MRNYFILIPILVMSCTKKLDVPEYLNFTPALVINGTLSPQQGALIEVSILLDPQKSHVVEENFVKDAKVRILDASGKLLEELIFIPQKGYVSQDTDFENGKTYGVEVQYLDFPLATTQIEIPPAIADMEVSITEFDDENTTAMISLKYQEPLKIFGNDRALNRGARDYPDTESPEVSKYFCNYVNPLFYDNSCQQPSLGTIEVSLWISGVVSDRSKIAEERWPYIIYDNLEIVLESITPLYKDYAAYIDQLPTDVDLLFTDQHVTPTNIQGGYGIIAGKSIHSIKINIQ